jgi:hypothetical protein
VTRLVLAALLLASCRDDRPGNVQAAEQAVDPALAQYLARLGELSPKEAGAIEAVMAQTGGGYKDDATLLAALKDTALPRYREFVAGLHALPAPGGELGAFHARLAKLADEELALLERLARAIERGDGTQVLFINREHARVRGEMEALVTELRPGRR